MDDKLIKKQLVDINDLLQFLSDSGFDINDGMWNKYEISLKEVFTEYKKKTILNVEIGQTVWIVRKSYKDRYEIRKCQVHRKQIRNRYTFSVQSGWYNGTFTKNSIGKTVFFSREDAVESIKAKKCEYEIIDD